MMNEQTFLTPSQFYRHRRPEYFSDSEIVAKAILPKEQLSFELSQIAINLKHDNFAILCRKLAEKLISPNLIPQVGPTGGGDGKTDTETYPVSEFISDRWFVSNNKWNKSENWAFAISAKQKWKPKVLSDVKEIISTKRDYTKIFFFSNQKISDKNRKETQDKIKVEYNIELIILDAEWILENIYSNELINVAIESLNLSRTYLEEKKIGSRDAERFKELEELEDKINSPNRFFEIDFQLFEDCLESAIVSRMLELPKAEVIGRFERAINIADKLKNIQLQIRAHYQFAWTLINWYDEYKPFYNEFLIVKELVQNEPNINNIEFYLNLINILKTISNFEDVKNLIVPEIWKEDEDFIAFITTCSQNIEKPSTSLLAKFHLSFFQIRNKLENGTSVSDELIRLKDYFQLSSNHLDIPFEQLKEMINVYGELLPDSEEYDNLIDVIAEIEANRVSELTSGQTYMNRGVTKLKNNLNKESLIYFGKASRKLAKEETQMEFYYCLMLLSDAYSKLDLYWASYNALVSASNIFANNWFTTGNLSPKFLRSVEEILKNEIIIGRVPVLLCWYELYTVIQRYFEQEVNNPNLENLPIEHMTDACLSVRLLNMDFENFHRFKYLPDIFKMNGLWLSEDATLYLLGHEDLIELDHSKTSLRKENFKEYYNMLASQPFVEQIAYKTNFLDTQNVSFESLILGIQLVIKFPQNTEFLILAESILAYFESFLATSFEDIFPISENINLSLGFKQIDGNFQLEVLSNNCINVYLKNSLEYNGASLKELMDALLPQLLAGNYMFKDAKEFLDNLFEKDEVHERLSIILEHHSFLTNVLTKTPKFFLRDWITNQTREYNLLRAENPITLDKTLQKLPKKEEKEERPTLKNVSHKKIKAETIINTELWDRAKWRAFGFFSSHQVPFGLLLSFENIDFGKKIFEDWINRFGKIDINETISITIIKGVDKRNPYWYKVLISKNIDKSSITEGNLITMSSRFHRMEPNNSTNLDNLLRGYQLFNKYVLIPAHVDKDSKMTPILELSILKTELKIKNAWEIGLNDFERVVITKEDNPVIPDDIVDAPILEVLKEKGM